MKLYVSGPMTGIDKFNFPAFEAAATALRQQGHDVLSAHEVDHGEKVPGGLPWTAYLRGDLRAMLDCDAIVLLRGWPKSKGARLELTTAFTLEMPVYYYDPSCGLIDLTDTGRAVEGLKRRVEDQPLPISNDLLGCHSMAVRSLSANKWCQWGTIVEVQALLMQRLQLGIRRYGTKLQPFNGRRFTRDLVEELADALAYSQGRLYEMQQTEGTAEVQVMSDYIKQLEDFTLYIYEQMVAEEKRG